MELRSATGRFLNDHELATCTHAKPLSRGATSANPRQPPMNRSVTPPADGAECGFAGRIEIAPQESRRRSRLGCSTAVASLARHGICSPRLVPRTGRHMPRRSSRSLGCAGDRPSAAPSGTAPKVAFASLMPAAAADPSSRLKLLPGRASPALAPEDRRGAFINFLMRTPFVGS